MITERSVYWILKLDDIRDLCSFGVGFFSLGSLFLVFIVFCIIQLEQMSEKTAERVLKGAAWYAAVTVLAVCPLCHLARTFVPSTKQMAAIKVLPAIARSEIASEMSTDAKELYRMGFSAIKETLTGKKEEK